VWDKWRSGPPRGYLCLVNPGGAARHWYATIHSTTHLSLAYARALSMRCAGLRRWRGWLPPTTFSASGASCTAAGLFSGGASCATRLKTNRDASCAPIGKRVGGSASRATK
jgi:hypothetical protein